jgi:hypothetical protein
VLVALLVSQLLLHSDASSALEELTLMARYSSACLGVLLVAMLEVAVAKVLTSGLPDRATAVYDKWLEMPADRGLAFDYISWQIIAAAWLAVNLTFLGHVLILGYRQHARRHNDAKRKAAHAEEAQQILRAATPRPDSSSRSTSASSDS